MKIKAFILALFLPFMAYSQCKGIIKNEIDEFKGYKTALVGDDGNLTWTLKGTKCDNCNSIGRLAFGRAKDTYTMRLHLFMNSAWSCNVGNTVEIKMKDGTVLNLKVNNFEISNHKGSSFMEWNGLVFVSITEDELKLFQTLEMDKIRVELTNGFAVTRVAKGEKVMEFAKCISSL